MRRRGAILLVILVIAVAIYGTYRFAYTMGESAGRSKVASDRTLFQTRIAGSPNPAAASQGQASGGQGGNAAGTRGAGSVRSGAPAAGGDAGGTLPAGTAANGRQGGAFSSVTGRVTKLDGTTMSVQQSDNATVTVTTTTDTAIRKLVAATFADLKMGDTVSVDGSKTGDTAVTAKTITRLGSTAATGAGNRGQGASVGTGGEGASPPVAFGQIKSVTGSSLAIQGVDGSAITVTTNAGTTVRVQQPGALSDIKMGDILVIQGEKTVDNTVVARSITNQGAVSPA